MPDEIIEVDENGKVHGLDPDYVKSDGERLAGYVASAWAEAESIKNAAGRGELGRQASIVATELEKVRALISYFRLNTVRLTPVSPATDAKEAEA